MSAYGFASIALVARETVVPGRVRWMMGLHWPPVAVYCNNITFVVVVFVMAAWQQVARGLVDMMHDRTVREVHELDVSSARAQIRAGCETASAAWIPSDAIADALLLECVDFTTRLTTQQHLIERLEYLVAVLKEGQSAGTLQ